MTALAGVGARAIPELVVFIAVAGIVALCVIIVALCVIIVAPFSQIARAQRVSVILGQEQAPFWLTGGSIALSNLGISPPVGAKWWWKDQISFVFIRHIAVRFSVDAINLKLIWEDLLLSGIAQTRSDKRLNGRAATEILGRLFATTPRYRQMVDTFSSLVGLENELAFLQNLKVETDRETAEEQRTAQPQGPLTHAPESRQTRSSEADHHSTKVDPTASWETLIIPQSLRENLQAYCRILRDYKAYRA
jgi:hypothetical protein